MEREWRSGREERLHVERREAAYFDILIGESECGNPRGGVCNLIPLPVRPITGRVSLFSGKSHGPSATPISTFPQTLFPPFPTAHSQYAWSTLALPPSSSLHHARAANLLLIATTKHPACEHVGTFDCNASIFARSSVFTDHLLCIIKLWVAIYYLRFMGFFKSPINYTTVSGGSWGGGGLGLNLPASKLKEIKEIKHPFKKFR